MPEEVIAGRYRIEREIGRGGMGVVYRARDLKLPRTVAIKMLPPELVNDPERRRRLAQEARAASALNHPGIATVYDYEETEGEAFIVTEYVEGSTLRTRLAARDLRVEEILELGIQLADALAAAHDRGIVHRDLKPENIMLTPGPQESLRTKILDFGLAKLREPLSDLDASKAPTATAGTAPGLLVGTVNYMSPEQLEGEPVDHRADIHALGLVLYEMAAGVNPFVGKTATSTIANILRQPAPPLAGHRAASQPELDRILRKCLRKRREERYQSARELLVDLANLRRDLAAPQTQVPQVGSPSLAAADTDGVGVFSRGTARILFVLIQAGYLTMYAMYFLKAEEVLVLMGRLVSADALLWNIWKYSLGVPSVIGPVLRLYLFSAVTADYPHIGRNFRLLFPLVFALDLLWAFAAFLPFPKVGGLVFMFYAALVYLPFVQRRLLYDAYSPGGGRTSAISR